MTDDLLKQRDAYASTIFMKLMECGSFREYLLLNFEIQHHVDDETKTIDVVIVEKPYPTSRTMKQIVADEEWVRGYRVCAECGEKTSLLTVSGQIDPKLAGDVCPKCSGAYIEPREDLIPGAEKKGDRGPTIFAPDGNVARKTSSRVKEVKGKITLE